MNKEESDKVPDHSSDKITTPDADNSIPTSSSVAPSHTDVFDLIDLVSPGKSDVGWKPMQPVVFSDEPKSFANDLIGIQFSSPNISKPVVINKENSPLKSSLLPQRGVSSSRRQSRRPGIRKEEFSHNRSSTPESIASEIRRSQQMVDFYPVDPMTQWSQFMQSYYRQFYPDYDFGAVSPAQQQPRRHIPKSAVPLVQQPTHSVLHPQQSIAPLFTGMPQPHASGMYQNQPQMNEYAAYFYQYYLSAMAAAGGGFPGSMGRSTPKVFIEPHVRATLNSPGLLIQVLPSRPSEGEPGRVEILDVSQLATDVVTEVTSRLQELSTTVSKLQQSSIFPTPSYGSSEGQSSTLPDDRDGVGDGEEEECIAIVSAWDRADHTFYPGPLYQGTTLKHDVQAFLRDKVEDIQDSMPVDWDSASLLLAYLELLVKHNGVLDPSDFVNLLLDFNRSRTYDYSTIARPTSASSFSNSRLSTLPNLRRQGSFRGDFMYAGLPLTLPEDSSGRESPHVLTHSASTGAFMYDHHHRSEAVSSNGGGGGGGSGAALSKLLKKSMVAGTTSLHDQEMASLDRFRELLMLGYPVKALDQACQEQLWGHAFTLAQRLGPAAVERVIAKFLRRALHPSDPLVTLYQLTAGDMPQFVDQLAYATGSDNGDWRPHMAMLLSAPDCHRDLAREALERMGESLLARRLLFAAHLCFILAAPGADVTQSSPAASTTTPCLSSKVWLLSIDEPAGACNQSGSRFTVTTAVQRAPSEAIQLTEVYEYALSLAVRDRRFFFPQFLPFKFAYCLRLIDAGLTGKAFGYLEVLSDSLITLLEQEGAGLSEVDVRSLFLLVSQCLTFAERLQHHPEVGAFDSTQILCSGGGSTSGLARVQKSSLHWLDRLRGAYASICDLLSFPNHYHPYVDAPEVGGASATHTRPTEASTPVHQASQSPPYSTSHSQQQQPLMPIQETGQQQQPHICYQQLPSVPPRRLERRPSNEVSLPLPEEMPSHPPEMVQTDDRRHHVQETNREPPPLRSPAHPLTPSDNANHSFFVPSGGGRVDGVVSFTDHSIPQHQSSPLAYDYFAAISSDQPLQSRSRTVSMASSHEGSSITTNPSPPSLGPSTPRPLMAQDRRLRRSSNNASSPLSYPRPHNSNSHFEDDALTPTNQSPSIFGSTPISALHQEPPQEDRHQPHPQAAAEAEPTPSSEAKSGAPGRSGWFSGLFGRMKGGGQEIHLPDDSNPSIIWDPSTGRWRNSENPDGEDGDPLPPPPLPLGTPITPSGVPSPLHLPPNDRGPLMGSRPVGGTRGRYVNVLANQSGDGGGGTTVSSKPVFQPPLPPTPSMMSS